VFGRDLPRTACTAALGTTLLLVLQLLKRPLAVQLLLVRLLMVQLLLVWLLLLQLPLQVRTGAAEKAVATPAAIVRAETAFVVSFRSPYSRLLLSFSRLLWLGGRFLLHLCVEGVEERG
jgi:hypothetical protein